MDILEIRQLEAFRTVMEHRSVTISAQILGITQPAVSAMLSKLETAVGYPLFVRAHRRLTPTPEATALYPEVVAVLDRHSQLVQTAQDIHHTRMGSLAIASHPGPSISWLPPMIATFMAERPGVTIKLISRQSKGVRDLIPTRSFDIAIAEVPIDHPLVAVKRYRTEFVAVLSATHPLADQPVITPTLLDGLPFICMFHGHAAQLGAARAFDESGSRLNVVMECDYFASAASLARRNVGVALIDSISAADLAHPELAIRPFAPTIYYDFAVFHPAERPLSKLARSFVQAFERHIGPFLR